MATRGTAVYEINCNMAVSGNGCDITYQVAITDPTMPPMYMGAIIGQVTVNLTASDTMTTYQTKMKNAIQTFANGYGFTVTQFVIPTYQVLT